MNEGKWTMIIILKNNPEPEQMKNLTDWLAGLSLGVHVSRGTGQTIVGIIGDTSVVDIDMIRCIYCGLCEEVCPEQAIFLRKDYSITGLTRAEMVHDKEKLYELGGVMNGLVHKWNEKK